VATRSQTENTDAIVVSIMKEKLGLENSEADLDRSHRLGRKVPIMFNHVQDHVQSS
jgi:hypothetical protein